MNSEFLEALADSGLAAQSVGGFLGGIYSWLSQENRRKVLETEGFLA